MNRHTAFLAILGTLFALLTLIFTTFPRSIYSELEKRDLAQFPVYSHDALMSGQLTSDISSWFSDSEPYRDVFMSWHMRIKDGLGIRFGGDDAVTFHAESNPDPGSGATDAGNDDEPFDPDHSRVGANAPAKVASAGIIVAGSEPTVRAMMVYKGEPSGGKAWAEMANFYHRRLGDNVRIYCMVIPTPIEYYCPEKVKSRTYSQLATIRNIHSLLDPAIKSVDAYSALGKHAAEDIYFRTDHHWTPLGAYYAAQQLARTAGVPFLTIDRYNRHSRSGFVGTMHSYSKDEAVKKSPEEFVWFTPKDSSYTTTYRALNLDKDFFVTSITAPYKGQFFMPGSYKGGASYSMFMGGDAKVTKVECSGPRGRRLLIIKDSFGNAVPPFLFGSFEQVHVVDYRYYVDNLEKYIRDNGITDLALINNIFNAYSPAVAQSIRTILTQPAGIPKRAKAEEPKPTEKKTSTEDQKPVTQTEQPAAEVTDEPEAAESAINQNTSERRL